MRTLPKLPVLGWAAYTGARQVPVPGVLSARHRCYTISGRAAISLALYVIGARQGSSVLVPTYHCTTMVAPVVHAGMTPLFYPITERGSPDLAWLGKADLAGVSAILAAHYFGLPQPMAALRQFCDERGIALIEDCAHAFFGASDGRPVGCWGDVAIASLTKFFPVPEGGMLVSDQHDLESIRLTSRSLHDELKAVADAIEIGARHDRFPGLNGLLNATFALKNRLRRPQPVAPPSVDEDNDHPPGSLPRRLLSTAEPATAVRWIVDGVHHARIVEARRENYQHLARLLDGLAGTRVLCPELPAEAVPYVMPLHVDDYQRTYQRLRATGVPIFCWDEIFPGTPSIEHDRGADWSARVFQLGCHQDLSAADIEHIAAAVRDVIQT